jgi:uncharacterized protein YcaQ
MKKKLTKEKAKTLLTRYHMINTTDNLEGNEGILKVMDRLQSIQQDPLDVVGRNVDLVMQSRVKDYTRDGLKPLLYQDRLLIDGWDKMMAIYQTKDFLRFEEVRKVMAEEHIRVLEYRNQLDALNLTDLVIETLKEGPKFANDIKLGGTQKSKWGQSKLSTAALDYLFFKGDIGVRDKKNNQKQYDIIDNLIDKSTLNAPFASKEEFIEYFLLRRIKALGICRDKNGVHLAGPYIYKKNIRDTYFKSLLDKKLIQEIEIEGIKETCYIPIEANQLENQIIDQVAFIAPLDNMLWDRDLIELLFNFKYRWEVYTPVSKREYGYYVLPILYRNEFIGRIEFKTHRGGERLEIINIWIDEKTKSDYPLDEAINKFEKYLKVDC